MKYEQVAVKSINPVDVSKDSAATTYVNLAADLGPDWGRVVVIDQTGTVVMGARVLTRAIRNKDRKVPCLRVTVSPIEARLLRMADFCDSDGLIMLTLERIVKGAP